jgi:hypothetical protein
MPFLVIANNLQNHSITLNITNKKSSLNQYYHVKNNSYCIPTDPSFDYYMKQYMIKLQLEESVDANADVSTTKDSVKAKRVYES